MVMIPTVDLNLALVLHTVLEQRSVARAAAKLHVTPSAVSNALARLRDLLGDPIVTREGRGIVPTPRAIELAPTLAGAIEQLESVFVPPPFDAKACTRTFTLAVADLGQITWVPRLAKAMEQELPLARLRVVGIEMLLSLGDLGSSEVDVQVGIAARQPAIRTVHLYDEAMMLVARKGHPWARRGAAPRLADLRFVRVDMAPARNLRDPFEALGSQSRARRNIVATVPSYTAAAEMVAHSDLVTMLPTSLVAATGRRARFCVLDASLPRRSVSISMCWHDRTHRDAGGQAFRALVREVAVAQARTRL
jgi:DNA-binding transcriptional LysR family regulator